MAKRRSYSKFKPYIERSREFYFQEFQKEFWRDRSAYSEDVIRQEFWDAWNAFWNSKNERKRLETARANQMSKPAGASSGPVRHTSGSRSTIKAYRGDDLLQNSERTLGRRPNATELYTRLHSTKADKKPVDKRAQDMTDANIARLAAATQSPTGEGRSSSPTAVYDEVVSLIRDPGVCRHRWNHKKKRVYGLGSMSSRYVGTSCKLQRGISSSSSEQADEEVERRVQAGIQEGLRLAQEQQAATMAQLVR
ncbi:uncharacterized protein LOC130015258 [Mercurialis annua]|uniref:uncharacterized protein LOC130015258 n=1 Tax=Mercurialis annua TaxID=3986 RepID=UPI0024AE1E6E|nr:uncharacterized protein LOC130015258 [Mercurialis annua]